MAVGLPVSRTLGPSLAHALGSVYRSVVVNLDRVADAMSVSPPVRPFCLTEG